MHAVIIGGGVTGITTAYMLRQRGHQVSVIETLEQPGLETSYANAGQRSYGVVYPWASKAMMKQVLPLLFKQDGPLKIKLPPSPATLRFLLQTLKYIFVANHYSRNKQGMLHLGELSRQQFLALEAAVALNFDGEHNGLIQLASHSETMKTYQDTAKDLTAAGIAHQLLDANEVRAKEPALSKRGPLEGGIYYPNDGTGDCRKFTQTLAQHCQNQGVDILYNHSENRLIADTHKVQGVVVTDANGTQKTLEADMFVICAGCHSHQVTAGIQRNVPIYPVKGYSLTATLTDPKKAPVSTIHDDYYKVVSTRLGNRLRATGFMELSGFDRSIPASRLQTIQRSVALRFPGCADLVQADAWCGFRPMTPDGPPMIGFGARENLFFNTGHGTFGWTLSLGSAHIAAQLIDGEVPAIDIEAFRPDRF